MNEEKLKNIVEATLFANGKAMTIEQILAVFPEDEPIPEKSAIKDAITVLQAEMENRSIELREVGSGYRFQVKQELTPWVSKLWDEKPQKYSRATLETLALIAYRQPLTRGEIEEIRGVSVSSNIVKSLLEREWIRVVGHRDVPGRPSLYATTKQFLDYFSLNSLEQLPPLSEIRDLDVIAKELENSQDEAVIKIMQNYPAPDDALESESTEEEHDEATSSDDETTLTAQQDDEASQEASEHAQVDITSEENQSADIEMNEDAENQLEETSLVTEQIDEEHTVDDDSSETPKSTTVEH